MNTALLANPTAIVPLTGVDLAGKEGYLVKESSGSLAINDSATAPARGVVLEGAGTTGQSSIGIIGALPGIVRLKSSGAITKFNLVQQVNDGTVTVDAGTGARCVVGVALEDAASGDLFLASLHTPLVLS